MAHAITGSGTDMLNLALYSDQIIPANAAVDRRLLAMKQSRGGGRRIGYMPSGPEPDRPFFKERQAYYARYGLELSTFFDPGEPHGGDELAGFFGCDAIHLPGGHTGRFLDRLRRFNLMEPLRRWATDGGILIGTSAGAILMTPTIAVDALFSGGRPEDVKNGDALGLLPFEFFPHLNGKPSYGADILHYSASTPRPIVACHDGDGIIISGGIIDCIGNPLWVAGGKVRSASDIEIDGLAIRH